ncbi:MAG: T9SS type A sorting domain-containing protein [Bacteroidales bacterium]|nr:T9SS type A sorting domain-containing protein [Bacteroidales bacterium]
MCKYTLLILFCFYSISVISQNITAPDTITENTIWNYDTVFVNNNVFIPDNIGLTIEPGTNIIITAYYCINIQGNIKAKGTETNKIKFTVSDTTNFSDTSTISGGWDGIIFDNTPATNDSSIFEYCILEYGKAIVDTSKGGVLYVNNFSKIRISNSIIQHNYSYKYGGGLYFENSSPIISNNEFYYNITFWYGGGIVIEGKSTALINNNMFKYNSAYKLFYYGTSIILEGGCGSAVYVSYAELYTTQNPLIINNRCYNNKTVAGAIYLSTYNAKAINNIICNNYGNGIMNGHQLSHDIYISNTICMNYTLYGGIKGSSNSLIIQNNVSWENKRIENDPQIDVSGSSTIEYNCIQGGYEGVGNISSEPEFVNPSPGVGLDYEGDIYDWSLSKNSPCINAGLPDTTGLYLPQYDLAGNLRIKHDTIDIGAYEYQLGINNIIDFTAFSKDFVLYPNPATDYINISLSHNNQTNKFEIYDITGKLILSEKLISTLTKIHITGLSKGLYFYRIKNNNKTIGTGKFIKQ